ncbi:glutathione S-transferase Mu 5-like [Pollicipes pollicipes]|uniref:glutathione S-transferase Mu 5-like n=1 Tax=Pollicipes pollicipes TaxID=41117 RepID=UPI001884D167|nr:glutathione S-transferase Mu 5-like [Pollicipes pollicipes]XP_037079987.1 glutathione S-transferase Mu 5-like [Pollicipes pollicipes]XP_037079988.1 glutathione S-transferase Mu 5-like [Pollicipes pollicipes]
MELGYWNIRGLAQPIRLLLEYTGEKFEDKKYQCGPPPDYDKSCWFDVKEKLKLDFPNLPYLIDGDTRITQSNAIVRYIGRKHDLLGKTEPERVRVDIMENQSMDFRNGLVQLCYNPNFDDLKDGYLKKVKSAIERFAKFLGDHEWFAGGNLTVVDFVMYELLDQHRLLDASLLEPHDNLKKFLHRFEELDAIKKYMASDRFMKSPLNNVAAKFGNK